MYILVSHGVFNTHSFTICFSCVEGHQALEQSLWHELWRVRAGRASRRKRGGQAPEKYQVSIFLSASASKLESHHLLFWFRSFDSNFRFIRICTCTCSHISRLVDAFDNCQYDQFKKAYAEILYRMNLLTQRAQVLKYVSVPSEPHTGIGTSTCCFHIGWISWLQTNLRHICTCLWTRIRVASKWKYVWAVA